jgi:hypothetical protein
MSAPFSILPCLLICASCATVKPQVVVKPVEVRRAVPAALLTPCPKPDRRAWRTTRDIVATADANEASLKQCAARVEGVRQWNAARP